ncbi:geranylgeranyl diphosphate synthase type II [Microbacterium endophyticum]|uniref:Geranylgeranyl diphosphate synthase type II n=1 Tax=Microbacterium endophyticum TaxID=1526412 RepID=A0A7W4V0R3_9MICO|nr:polyprenyl synthetase family protein [Microbacterium endophyticum]MBB2974751.1 geranylgeranyl diphosphate synthase type II [Microbacterium endophyticum]NIK37048.1 geranylgeranyl diphosphate synthase type II [Microbacterium endophyticum]
MITLTHSEDLTLVDRAIDGAIDRICERSRAYGESAQALAEAIRRAALGGKRFRPLLVSASFNAFGGNAAAEDGMPAIAAAFELLHTAFVVHDDVIDHDTMRRGQLNIAGTFSARAQSQGANLAGSLLFGEAAAILAGDLLLHEANRLVALAPLRGDARTKIIDLIDDAVFVSAVGELSDVENSVTGKSTRTESLIATAHDKTAVYSFSSPLRAGALLAGADEAAIAAVGKAGSSLGLAFQLVDDLIGAFGTQQQAGREPGADLRESKQTALIALARQTTAWPRVSAALSQAHTGPVAVREAQHAIAESGARDELMNLVIRTIRTAREQSEASALPPRVEALLADIANAVEERIP